MAAIDIGGVLLNQRTEASISVCADIDSVELGSTEFNSVESESILSPSKWNKSCVHTECTMHQLSPYIGKMKSSIASDLIEAFTKKGDIVFDPFAGSGTVLLEAKLKGRSAIGADISSYSQVLCEAKLNPPSNLDEAIARAEYLFELEAQMRSPDLDSVPDWVKSFFHPKTLREIINFSSVCKIHGEKFILACLLGILHHQRPGFLSYPSSHLVPYLRDKKYPRNEYPEMYAYRDYRPRILSKLKRAYKRYSAPCQNIHGGFIRGDLERVDFPDQVNCIITSPPYMNALDYGRDNRLRLWFLESDVNHTYIDKAPSTSVGGFDSVMKTFAEKVNLSVSNNGYCILIIGAQTGKSYRTSPSETAKAAMGKFAPNFQLINEISDDIPDIRRSRRSYKGVRTEDFLVFQRSKNG